MLDEHLSGIALNAGKLVQTQTTLSADQLKKGGQRKSVPHVWELAGIEPASAF